MKERGEILYGEWKWSYEKTPPGEKWRVVEGSWFAQKKKSITASLDRVGKSRHTRWTVYPHGHLLSLKIIGQKIFAIFFAI